MPESSDVPEEAMQELLDEFGVSDLRELDRMMHIIETGTGKDPRDDDWSWDSPPEFYFHEFHPDSLRADLESYLDERAEVYEEVAFYRDHGSFRDTTPLTTDEQEYVDDHVFNTVPNQCYYNAQTGMGPKLTYVEGYRTSPLHPRPAPHAWLDLNGKVVEVTIPDEFNPNAVYYGVSYSAETVAEAMADRERADPLVEDPDLYEPLDT